MSPKEKTKFDDLAKQDKARYDQEMMSFNPGKKSRKQKKDPNAPRRPPYVLFPLRRLISRSFFIACGWTMGLSCLVTEMFVFIFFLFFLFPGLDFSCSVQKKGPA